MTRWARLTWQSAEPATLAADLGRRLGVALGPHPSLDDAFVLPLGGADLEVVPWRRETPDDDPQPAGRLVFEPVEDGAPDPASGGEVPPLTLAGVAWATVELDRAEAELGAWLTPVAGPATDAPAAPAGDSATDRDPAEPHLGARTRTRGAPALPGEVLVLCEPATEGRLAASLARDGEGPCAMYLAPREGLGAWTRAARARGTILARPAAGPFGRSVLLPGGGPAGPHVILIEVARPSSG